MTAEDNEAGDYDEQERADLDDTDAIGEPVRVLCVEHQGFGFVRLGPVSVMAYWTYSR